MKLPHNSVVLVADGRKLLFLRNEGDDQNPNLVVERKTVDDNPSSEAQTSDAPGSTQASIGPGGSAYEPTDFHQLQEDRFAADAADMLKRRALANEFHSLVVVAPPKTLGELRKHYHKEVSDRLAGELDKDLTGHPIDQIEAALQRA